jgi:hypothetical protein
MSDVIRFPHLAPRQLKPVANRPEDPIIRDKKRRIAAMSMSAIQLLEWTDRTIAECDMPFAIDQLENALRGLYARRR